MWLLCDRQSLRGGTYNRVLVPAPQPSGALVPELGAISIVRDHMYDAVQGVVNRDIKLENTLLDGSKRPLLKICDFGYSKNDKDSVPKSKVGTPGYTGEHARPLSLCLASIILHHDTAHHRMGHPSRDRGLFTAQWPFWQQESAL